MEESLPFPVSVGLLPTAPSSGITSSKKGIAISAILGVWDREFAACGERKTSSVLSLSLRKPNVVGLHNTLRQRDTYLKLL